MFLSSSYCTTLENFISLYFSFTFVFCFSFEDFPYGKFPPAVMWKKDWEEGQV